MHAPIVLFVYNRPWHTKQTLCTLSENELAKDSILYVYADGAKENASEEDLKKIKETRDVIREKQWCKEVKYIESDKNNGLANSVIIGVSEVIKKYGKIIVLEDDLITSKNFLKYMNNALTLYENEERVMQVSGHCFPAISIPKNNSSFFLPMTTSWGWATWKRSWNKFDKEALGYEILKSDKEKEKVFNLGNSYPYSHMLINQMESNTIDSWAIRWWWSVFKEEGISLFPDKSLVKNIGFGMESTHTKGNNPFLLKDFDKNYYIYNFPVNTNINEVYFGEITKYIRSPKKNQFNLKREFALTFKNLWRFLCKTS